MNRFPVLLIILLAAYFGASTQSRNPELVVPHYAKVKAEALADSSGYEAHPYFILVDESEKALAEGKYADAALRLVEAMGIEPDNPLNVALMSNLGMIYHYDGKDTLALQCLDEVVRRSPKLIAGHDNRARVLAAIGRDKEAYEEFGRVIELDSLNTDSRFYHGMMALYAGNLPVAERDFAVLEKVIPVSRNTYLAMGTLYALTSREAQAQSYLRKLVDIAPEVEYYLLLADCYLVDGRLGEASDLLGKALQRYPDDYSLYLRRARLNKARYDSDAADRDVETAINLGADPRIARSVLK